MAIVFIIFFFLFLLLSILLIYKYKCRKEENVHNEVLKISENQTINIKTLFSNANAYSPIDPAPDIIFLEQYKKKIFDSTFEEYKQNISGDLAPVRKNRYKKRIRNRRSR